ncbi:FAD:protein FMN transferase [Shewanella sp.]|uniref:FAD:protein FMN transferase n=1 Tax=Shewanella sp. TaxID=50422 RepID=UPI004048E3E4
MIRRAKPLLGTLVEIAIMPDNKTTSDLNTQQCNAAIMAAFSRIESISQQLSFHQLESQLTQLNRSPGQWCAFSRDGIRILHLSRVLGRLTDNRFNCTVGGELVNSGALPHLVEHTFLPQGTWQDIQLSHQYAKLSRPVLVTLDGIAKGFAVDMAVSTLKRYGVKHGWVNAGGDLKVFGSVELPVKQRTANGLSEPTLLINSALASSQVSNCFDKDYPAQIIANNELNTQWTTPTVISVQAKYAWRADALTKVAAMLPKQSYHLIDKLCGKVIQF